jgi:hypothetical protein
MLDLGELVITQIKYGEVGQRTVQIYTLKLIILKIQDAQTFDVALKSDRG